MAGQLLGFHEDDMGPRTAVHGPARLSRNPIVARNPPSLVQAYFDGISDRPGKCAAGLAALKQLEKWAVVRDLLPRPITTGVEIETSDDGHIPWTDDQVLLGETNARADLARA